MMRVLCVYAARMFGVLLVCMALPAQATVKVGNGGDVIDSFLEQMRRSLVQVVAKSRPEKPVWQNCYKMNWLNADQQALCVEFTRSALVPIFNLNVGTQPTKLQQVQEPIVTRDADGNERRVAAGTECGPIGPIVFHYDTVRTYSPKQLFFLMAHEFGHKVSFRSQACVSDNESIGAFSGAGGGRLLMDAFAWVLTQEAIDRNEIGEDFGLLDVFRCGWENDSTGDSSAASVVAQRVVFDKGVFDRFETGVGLLPRDSMCELANSRLEPGVKYLVRLKISENAGCRKTRDSNSRRTEIGVLKVFAPEPNGSTRDPELISNQVFEGVNPICEEEPKDFVAPFVTSFGNFSFVVRYLSTQTLANRSLARQGIRSAQFFLK